MVRAFFLRRRADALDHLPIRRGQGFSLRRLGTGGLAGYETKTQSLAAISEARESSGAGHHTPRAGRTDARRNIRQKTAETGRKPTLRHFSLPNTVVTYLR